MSNFQSNFNTFGKIFNSAMVLIYAGVGGLFLFMPDFGGVVKGTTRYIMGFLLIIYSVYRVIRIIKSIKEEKNEEA